MKASRNAGRQAFDEIICTAPAVLEPPNDHCSEGREGAEKHPLLIWSRLAPGDVVSLRVAGSGDYVGTVEATTNDGLIVWFRDALSERRLFHFRDCLSVRILR